MNQEIPYSSGKTIGQNLFHSFSQFDLPEGSSATFTAPADLGIRNVLARVTHEPGSMMVPSIINGTINVDIAGANFFFINPFGVMFGPHAAVNVSGSFVVTTADYVKLDDGAGIVGRFDARNPANDVLKAAPVSAFGFLGPTTGSIRMQGPSLNQGTPVLAELAEGKSFVVVGGDIHMDNVQITAPSGRVALVSVNSAGELSVNVDDLTSSIDTSLFSQLGDIELINLTTIDVSGDPGGRVDIQAQNLMAHDLNMVSSSFGSQNGLGIDFQMRDAITLRGLTFIYSDASDTGAAGGISMTAKSILFRGEPLTGLGSVNILTDTFGPGKAGDVAIHADTLVMQNGVLVSADTAGSGDGGSISISAQSILMEGQQSKVILSSTSYEGQAGSINIQTDTLTLKADAQIIAKVFGPSPAGTIEITAKQVSVDGRGASLGGFTGISTDSGAYDHTSGLSAGDIVINVDTLSLSSGARMSASSSTDSPGGNIVVNATREIRLADSRITTQAGGDGGNVHLTAPLLVYLLDSQITAESVNGDGGNVTIDPQFVVLNDSQINTSAGVNGGAITIISDYVLASPGLDESLFATGERGVDGIVTITAPDLDLSGSLVELPAELLGAETLLRPLCAERLPGGVSSFMVLGRGGVPATPEMLLPANRRVSDGSAK